MKRGAQGGGGAKKRRSGHGTELTAGMRGVIITCDSHLEHKAIRECFERFGMVTETGPRASGPKDDAAGAATGGTAGDALAREIEALKQGGRAAGARPAFSVAQTGCAGNVMIRFEGEALDPIEIVEQVMEEALTSRCSGAPHIVRMLPVQASCSAHVRNIVQTVEPLVQAALRGFEGTFAVQWRRRHNTSLDKMEVINAVAGALAEVAPKARLQLPPSSSLLAQPQPSATPSLSPTLARPHPRSPKPAPTFHTFTLTVTPLPLQRTPNSPSPVPSPSPGARRALLARGDRMHRGDQECLLHRSANAVAALQGVQPARDRRREQRPADGRRWGRRRQRRRWGGRRRRQWWGRQWRWRRQRTLGDPSRRGRYGRRRERVGSKEAEE